MKKLVISLTISIIILFQMSVIAQQSVVKVYANKTLNGLKTLVKNGKQALEKIITGSEVSEIDSSMQRLQDVVLAASERAKRLSDWNLTNIENEAEQAFATTINAIEEYLSLVNDDGPVHKASNRIRTAALDQARIFREKASAKSSQRYIQLAEVMDTQARKVTDIWNSIKNEREIAQNGLEGLKSSQELYVDVKKAQGIQAAVKELEGVKLDLAKLSASMAKVQQAVIGESTKIIQSPSVTQ